MLKIEFQSSGQAGRIVDEFNVPIQCPHCGHEMNETFARLKSNPTVTCVGCSKDIHIETDETFRESVEALSEIDKSIFAQFGKR